MYVLGHKNYSCQSILIVLGIYTFGSLTNVQLEFHVKSAKSQLKSRLNYYYTTTVLLNGAVEGFHHDNLRKSQSSLLGSYQVYEFVEPLKPRISHLNGFFFFSWTNATCLFMFVHKTILVITVVLFLPLMNQFNISFQISFWKTM